MRRIPNLGDEHGVALVMALGSLVVLSILLTIGLEVSSSSGRHAVRSNADEKAYRLAEAGLNNAVAVIAKAGADTSKVKPQPSAAGDVNSTVQTLEGGTVTWGGSFDAATKTWSIKSIGSARSSASGTSTGTIDRTVTGKVQITPPSIVFASLNSTTEKHTLIIQSGGDLTVNNAIYVNTSNGDDGFDIKGSGGSIKATAIYTHGGWEVANTNPKPEVWVAGTKCTLAGNQFFAPTTGPGCPVTGAAIQADPFASVPLAPTPGAATCAMTEYSTAAYANAQKTDGATGTALTINTKGGVGIAVNDVIKIENELILVQNVSGGTGGKYTLTVVRGYGGTSNVNHADNKAILKATALAIPSAAAPRPCNVQTGTITLQPGTYYGGVCIGTDDCTGTQCTKTTGATSANVTLAAGTYIMAGGGFKVCGTAQLNAPNVMLYNTNDQVGATVYQAIGGIILNTSGSVTLGPQTTGTYAGMTIFQNRTLAVTPANSCDSKAKSTASDEWDIGFASMATTGTNGVLGSVSGTIYAAHDHAMFADLVSGTANLAVLTGCIYVEGTTSTFNFDAAGLYGNGLTFLNQSG